MNLVDRMPSKFKNILIAYKTGLKDSSKKIMEIIHSFDSSIKVVAKNHNHIKKEDLLDKDLIITFGGDGTFIESANLIVDSYILGINSHPRTSEGALTSLDINQLDKILDVLKGNYRVLERQRASIILNGKVLEELSTNEVYLGAKSQFHSSRYIISYRDKSEEHRSSGVLVSTGTGSTAWFKSAGGKEFNCSEKKLEFIIREPYPGKKIYIPTILSGEIIIGERLVIESTRDFGGILAIGFKTYSFNKGDIAIIELSDKPLRSLALVKT